MSVAAGADGRLGGPYEYLWHRRAATADKDHPACVVATFRQQGRPEDFVVYLPISHTPPSGEDDGIELTDAVKRKIGLDARRQWILVSECNVDTWPFDLQQLPDQLGRFRLRVRPTKHVQGGAGRVRQTVPGVVSQAGGTVGVTSRPGDFRRASTHQRKPASGQTGTFSETGKRMAAQRGSWFKPNGEKWCFQPCAGDDPPELRLHPLFLQTGRAS